MSRGIQGMSRAIMKDAVNAANADRILDHKRRAAAYVELDEQLANVIDETIANLVEQVRIITSASQSSAKARKNLLVERTWLMEQTGEYLPVIRWNTGSREAKMVADAGTTGNRHSVLAALYGAARARKLKPESDG